MDADAWLVLTREDNLDPISVDIGAEDIVGSSAFIFSRDGRTAAIVANYDENNIRSNGIYDTVKSYASEGLATHLRETLSGSGVRRLAIDTSQDHPVADGLTLGMKATLDKALLGLNIETTSAEQIITILRAKLLPAEIKCIKRAVSVTMDILEEASRIIKPGRSDRQIFDFIISRMHRQGVEPAWPETMCPGVFVEPGPVGHKGYSGKIIKRGTIVRIDFGVKYSEYCSDIQRVWYVLPSNMSEPSRRVVNMFETAMKANDAAKKALSAGVEGLKVDEVARRIVVDSGFPEFKHATGYPIARTTHEIGPLLGPPWTERYGNRMYWKIEPDMAFTIEPTVHHEEVGAINLEEDVLVTETGCRNISPPQTELFYVK